MIWRNLGIVCGPGVESDCAPVVKLHGRNGGARGAFRLEKLIFTMEKRPDGGQ
jgi:hypothetical protein